MYVERKITSRTCVVIDCTVIINSVMDYHGAQTNIKIKNGVYLIR
jgi:hypothetical protein